MVCHGPSQHSRIRRPRASSPGKYASAVDSLTMTTVSSSLPSDSRNVRPRTGIPSVSKYRALASRDPVTGGTSPAGVGKPSASSVSPQHMWGVSGRQVATAPADSTPATADRRSSRPRWKSIMARRFPSPGRPIWNVSAWRAPNPGSTARSSWKVRKRRPEPMSRTMARATWTVTSRFRPRSRPRPPVVRRAPSLRATDRVPVRSSAGIRPRTRAVRSTATPHTARTAGSSPTSSRRGTFTGARALRTRTAWCASPSPMMPAAPATINVSTR